ncbi:glutaredoxin family protein [Catenovulum sediminis]|uniref:glutaredoxin family protein n=1 Tax=Catenovulum sediminis TaxID=1740262 RepID=UPI00117DEBE5|nr:glutaredoxin family protein [Catenovulum sediminis]
MSELLLYGTEGCHLCEYAEKVIQNVGLAEHVRHLDIAEDPALVAQFGTLIPVILDSSNNEFLSWPFDEQQLIKWLDN